MDKKCVLCDVPISPMTVKANWNCEVCDRCFNPFVLYWTTALALVFALIASVITVFGLIPGLDGDGWALVLVSLVVSIASFFMARIIRYLQRHAVQSDKRHCAVCAIEMHDEKTQSGAVFMEQIEPLAEFVATKAIRCARCNIEFCARCSASSGIKRGKKKHVCPICGGDVDPNFA